MLAAALLLFAPLLLSALDLADSAEEAEEFRDREDNPDPTPTSDYDQIDLGGGDDVYQGTGAQEDISGQSGDDAIAARGGADILRGGTGDDVLKGESGADQLIGGNGNDVLSGDQDDDALFGELGRDTLFGGAGNDTLSGGGWSDYLEGGDGADTLSGGYGDDVLTGGKLLSRDLSFAELRDLRDTDGENIRNLTVQLEDDGVSDTLVGGHGDDVLNLGAGDFGYGGSGSDFFGVLAEANRASGGATEILDFDPDEDVIAIAIPETQTTLPSAEVNQVGKNVEVVVESEVVAILRNVNAADLTGQNAVFVGTTIDRF